MNDAAVDDPDATAVIVVSAADAGAAAAAAAAAAALAVGSFGFTSEIPSSTARTLARRYLLPL